tara:strand:+ start:176686 stop:177075 length:390 start_codon:yes stop_codon:yes gene_type:complete
MRNALVSTFILAQSLFGQQAANATTDSARIDLAVLVTGIPDSDRLADFERFLGQHFTKVGTASYSKFRAEQADGYDVVLFDCEVRPQPGRIGLRPAPELSPDFARASVMISGAGALLAERKFESKIDWH